MDLNAYKIEGWHYVETQEDIDFILKETSGFHDSVLKDLVYESGSYVNEKNAMSCRDCERKITMRFDSQWCCRIELVFEGVVALNLRPFQDDDFSNINGATLLLKNASIFFCNDIVDAVDEYYQGTWIEAYSLRWRFV